MSAESVRRLFARISFDAVDAIVVGSAAAVVVAVTAASALTGAHQPRPALLDARVSSAPASRSTVAPSASAPVDVIATGLAAAPVAAELADGLRHSVTTIVGNGYSAPSRDYASLASEIDRDAAVVVIVPSNDDASLTPLSWTAALGRTVHAVEQRAPRAQVLLVGPVVADAQASRVQKGAAQMRAFASSSGQHYLDGVAHHWVGTRVDTRNELPTADALTTAGRGIGAEVRRLLAR